MELIKLSENKTRLILSHDELEVYGISRDKQKNLKAIERIFLHLKNSSDIDLTSVSATVKVKLCDTGECEITVEKTNFEFEIKTFIFNEKQLELLFTALKNTDYRKNSALYKYKDIYILELLSPKNSPLPSRISDFGKEITLYSRRDFLSGVCTRVNFP